MSAYTFPKNVAQATSPLASTKRSVYMTLPFVDFKRVLEAQRTKTKLQYRQWVVRSVLRQFESCVRAQQRQRVEMGGRIVGPDELYASVISNPEVELRRYQLAESDIPVAAELIRLKLQLKYLVGEVEL
jgi:hypothetical protein